LATLGISKGSTPALQSQVGRLTVLLPSIELARGELRRQGPTLDEKAVHRMTRQLGAEVLATRTRDLQRWRDGQAVVGQEMAGQHVVAQVDGGRVRIRTQIETTKRQGVKHRRKVRIEWRERPSATTSRSVERRCGGKCHQIPISREMDMLGWHSMINRACPLGHSENFLFLI
jgi:hypothetical protein